VTFNNTNELKSGSHDIIFFLTKDDYLTGQKVAIIDVNEPTIIDRIRPLIESEITWILGQLVVALGVIWKFNTIVIRRLRGKVTTCSQCGRATSTLFPRCSACGHIWIAEGVSDLKDRLIDILGDLKDELLPGDKE